MKKSRLHIAALSVLYSAMFTSYHTSATVVEFDISIGTVNEKLQISLYDESTPETVANFLNYVNSGAYTDNIIHRTVTDFIIQGGGYSFDTEFPLTKEQANSVIRNEPVWSNVAGTIAMAKVGGYINSATREWFFNIADNSANLDLQNGGFTVFGQVLGNGMDVLAAIAAVPTCAYSTSLSTIPMPRDAGQVCSDLASPTDENFVTINAITIIDNNANTVDDLTLTTNNLLDSDLDGELNINDDDDDGDGVVDTNDLYPFDPFESADTDGDGVPDNTDKFPEDATEIIDSDNDGIGNNADTDDDNDGEPDVTDAFPLNPSEQFDEDGDGVGDNSDEFLGDATEWRDIDKDGMGDNADACPLDKDEQIDTDGDGYCDGKDKFPNDATEYLDSDLDGIGDVADLDDDNDGVLDVDDFAPYNPDITKQPVYNSGSSGGSLTWFALLSLGLIRVFRRK